MILGNGERATAGLASGALSPGERLPKAGRIPVTSPALPVAGNGHAGRALLRQRQARTLTKQKRSRNIGLVPHADAGSFTILWQNDSGGLEIQNKSGEWVGAPPIDETFVINIGNVLQTWTNGRFSSTPHRVINRSNRDRYSVPLFVNPSYDIEVRPLVDVDRNHSTAFNYGTYQRDVWRQTFPIAEVPN